MRVGLKLGCRAPSAGNAREHWAARHRRVRSLRTVTWGELHNYEAPPAGVPVRVTVTRVDRRKLDKHDNLRHTLKPVVDGIASWMRRDDSDDAIDWRYDQRTANGCNVEILVEWGDSLLTQ